MRHRRGCSVTKLSQFLSQISRRWAHVLGGRSYRSVCRLKLGETNSKTNSLKAISRWPIHMESRSRAAISLKLNQESSSGQSSSAKLSPEQQYCAQARVPAIKSL